MTDEVCSYPVLAEGNLFEELLASVRFEDVGKGRQGAVLIKVDETGCVPIVRTTTRYSAPAQHFQTLHEQLARQIQKVASLPVGFNNALIESYTNAYATMGGHSDQALDLADESFIAIFSCYRYPDVVKPPRRLLVKSKGSVGRHVDIPLAHNGALVFSVDANRRLEHKIVLDSGARAPENQWLGITFRTSKTVVRFRDGRACFEDGASLTLADEEQKRMFYRLRGRENSEVDFRYPRITYSVSESDLMPPEPAEGSPGGHQDL
ncbi:MAG: hypothetical protein ABI193_04435 [Minicystis sp.]